MGWVGWSEKVQKPAYVMYEGSLMKFRLFNVRERPLMMYDFRVGWGVGNDPKKPNIRGDVG